MKPEYDVNEDEASSVRPRLKNFCDVENEINKIDIEVDIAIVKFNI